MRMYETCWAVFKRQAINLRNCCIWLVDSLEYMMMNGLTNPNFKSYNVYHPPFFPLNPYFLLRTFFSKISNKNNISLSVMFSGNSHSVTFLNNKLQKRNICTQTTSERQKPVRQYWRINFSLFYLEVSSLPIFASSSEMTTYRDICTGLD